MIKVLLFCAAALPVLIFLRRVLWRRSPALRRAGAEFHKQVGYVAAAMVAVALLALAWQIYAALSGR